MSRRPLIILSGAYCTADIVAELGRLPPAFLPAGACRLFEHQLALAQALDAEPVITLPAGFEIDPEDDRILGAAGARIIRTPLSLSLPEALHFVLEVIQAEGELYLLHGDTLIDGPGLAALDIVATHETNGYYAWADVERIDNDQLRLHDGFADGRSPRQVACGYFTFSDAARLRQEMAAASSFVEGLNAYAKQVPLRPVAATHWYDFGHLPLMYRSKRDMLVSRAFNALVSDGVSVTKTSDEAGKLAAEIDWYRSIPEEMRAFTPQFLGQHEADGRLGCRLEYLYQPNLAELFVFGRLPSYVWRTMLRECLTFLEHCQAYTPPAANVAAAREYPGRFFDAVIVEKSRERVRRFLSERGWGNGRRIIVNGCEAPPVEDVVESLVALVPPTTVEHIRLWHGDFFFGNVFYDFRASRVRVIDPRGGIGGGIHSVYGDWRYDAAKLAHSVSGRYDMILAGRAALATHGEGEYSFQRPMPAHAVELEHDLASLSIAGMPALAPEIRAITALLFLSMLPMHAEDRRRQDMLLCNGLCLYLDLIGGRP